MAYYSDFRVIINDTNAEGLDVVTGELLNESSTAQAKLYRDFLKSSLTTKVHLNAALKHIPYIPPTKIKTVIALMIQIMGLSCVVYDMNLIDKKIYTLQRISTFTYPSTFREVKAGGINAIVNGLSMVETMINNIEDKIVEYRREPKHDMTNIKIRRKKSPGVKKTEATTAQAKVYQHFLKSALTTKVHLNAALKRMP